MRDSMCTELKVNLIDIFIWDYSAGSRLHAAFGNQQNITGPNLLMVAGRLGGPAVTSRVSRPLFKGFDVFRTLVLESSTPVRLCPALS